MPSCRKRLVTNQAGLTSYAGGHADLFMLPATEESESSAVHLEHICESREAELKVEQRVCIKIRMEVSSELFHADHAVISQGSVHIEGGNSVRHI